MIFNYIYINQHGYAINSTRVVPCLQYYNYIAIYDSRDNYYVRMAMFIIIMFHYSNHLIFRAVGT